MYDKHSVQNCWKLNFLHKLISYPDVTLYALFVPPSRGCRKTCAKILNTEFKQKHRLKKHFFDGKLTRLQLTLHILLVGYKHK